MNSKPPDGIRPPLTATLSGDSPEIVIRARTSPEILQETVARFLFAQRAVWRGGDSTYRFDQPRAELHSWPRRPPPYPGGPSLRPMIEIIARESQARPWSDASADARERLTAALTRDEQEALKERFGLWRVTNPDYHIGTLLLQQVEPDFWLVGRVPPLVQPDDGWDGAENLMDRIVQRLRELYLPDDFAEHRPTVAVEPERANADELSGAQAADDSDVRPLGCGEHGGCPFIRHSGMSHSEWVRRATDGRLVLNRTGSMAMGAKKAGVSAVTFRQWLNRLAALEAFERG